MAPVPGTEITADAVHELLVLADTPASSGASSLTRGQQVRAWCVKDGLLNEGAQLRLDAFRTGFDLLSWGHGGLRMLASASFVCETRGALAAIARIDPDIAQRRAATARRDLREVP